MISRLVKRCEMVSAEHHKAEIEENVGPMIDDFGANRNHAQLVPDQALSKHLESKSQTSVDRGLQVHEEGIDLHCLPRICTHIISYYIILYHIALHYIIS